jgi:hypothetical protein
MLSHPPEQGRGPGLRRRRKVKVEVEVEADIELTPPSDIKSVFARLSKGEVAARGLGFRTA